MHFSLDTLNDDGLALGGTGSVRIQGPEYDQVFLATKTSSAPAPQYTFHFINCLWGRDLPARYDSQTRLCTALFDPGNVFTDRTAPDWDGLGMKSGVDYFGVLQVGSWIWSSAGASNGLAIAWGPAAAESLLHPFGVPVGELKLIVLGRTDKQFILQIMGDPGKSFTIQSCVSLTPPVPWGDVLTTNHSAGSFTWTDGSPPASVRFYRVRQP